MGLVRYYDIAIGYVIVPIFRYIELRELENNDIFFRSIDPALHKLCKAVRAPDLKCLGCVNRSAVF